jgi:hypothetical protein
MEVTIESIVGDLGDTYFIREDAQKLQDSLRTEFFEAAKGSQSEEFLATKVWTAPEEASDPEASQMTGVYFWLRIQTSSRYL